MTTPISTSKPQMPVQPSVSQAVNTPAPPSPTEAVAEPRDEISIAQAAKGLAGAVAVAGIETVGNTASAIVHLPSTTVQAYKSLYQTAWLGPVLKGAVGLTLPAAIVAAPVLTALGSMAFGLYRGADKGSKMGLSNAVKTGLSDVNSFNQFVASVPVETRNDASTILPAGQKPYEIRVGQAALGIVAGACGAVIDGAGIGLSTLANTPRGLIHTYRDVWKSDQGPVLKTFESLLLPAAAILAPPIALVGGTLYGLFSGSVHGYHDGLGASLSSAMHDVTTFNKQVDQAMS